MLRERINLDWGNFNALFEFIRLNARRSFLGSARYVWGRVVSVKGESLKVQLGLKSPALCPIVFLNDFKVEPKLGMFIPCYVSNLCDATGKVRLNQERLIYLVYKWYMGLCSDQSTNLVATIERYLWKGTIVSILPHVSMGQPRSFSVFLPTRQNISVVHKLGSQIVVNLHKVDYKGRNVVAHVNQELINEQQRFEFEQISLHKFVSGTVLQVKPHGGIILINNFSCFLPIKNMFYSYDNLEVKDYLTIGQEIPNLYVLSKNVEDMKIYLSARHIFDHLNNYFKEGQRVNFTVKFIRGNRAHVADKQLTIPLHLKYLSYCYYEYAQVAVGDQVSLIYDSQKASFSLPHKGREDYWRDKSLPKEGEVVTRKLIHIDKKNVKFLGDGKSYIMKFKLVNKVHKALSQFQRFYDGMKLDVVAVNFNYPDGYYYVMPLELKQRLTLLTMGRRLLAMVNRVHGNVLHLDLTPYLSTTVTLRGVSEGTNLQKGARIEVKVTKISLSKKTCQVSLV